MRTYDLAQRMWGLAVKKPCPVHQDNQLIRSAAQRLTDLQDSIGIRDAAELMAGAGQLPPGIEGYASGEALVAIWTAYFRRAADSSQPTKGKETDFGLKKGDEP